MKYLEIGKEPELQLVYEDKSILLVNKPAGQLFHGYTRGAPSPLVDQVKSYIRTQSDKSGGVYLGVVHRLDRPVSGLSLFARNSKAAGRMAEQFRARTLEKIYLAILEANTVPEQGELVDELESPPGDADPKVQTSRLSFQRVAEAEGRTLVAIQLGTGRRHQIRMQFASRGWPLVGDLTYGASTPIPAPESLDPRFQAIALHAAALHFQHPLSFEPQKIQAPLPFYWPLLSENLARASLSYLSSL